jgi:hypothetical protein
MNIKLEPDAAKIRQIHHSLFSTKDALTTFEAEAFLFLPGDQLLDGLNGYVREFLKRKLACETHRSRRPRRCPHGPR